MTKPRKISRVSQILASVLINSIYAMQNFPIMLLNSMLVPFSFLIVIDFISHGALLGIAIEGAFIMTMVTAGLGLQSDLSHLKNDMHFQDMIVSSPTSAFTYIIGMALSELVYYLPNMALLSVMAVIYMHLTAVAALIIAAVMLVMFSFSIALSFMLSTLSSDVIQSFAFTSLISTLLATIPPVYYPITYIPFPYRYIAYISPTTYAAQIAQSAAGFLTIPISSIVIDWIVLISVAIALLLIAAKNTRWREK